MPEMIRTKSRAVPVFGGRFTGELNEKMFQLIMRKHFNHEAFKAASKKRLRNSGYLTETGARDE